MAFFPILIELEGQPCLVAGGGNIALHKAEVLLREGADVTVVAPEICPELMALPVKKERRSVAARDAENVLLVVDASGSKEAEDILSKICKERHIPYICSGRGDACTAIFPAIFRKGRTTVAVSSLGASPPASAWLRDELAGYVPDNMDEVLERMAQLRSFAKERIGTQEKRKEFFHRCLSAMLESGNVLSDGEAVEILKEYTD